ncbi:hypothetical protein CFP56_013081 [Quercus suber]|uniref:Uncharacterized protein n=1 Tax=Quercus suber TaxID=58331 RepID=A0AAW0M6D6_QUESU
MAMVSWNLGLGASQKVRRFIPQLNSSREVPQLQVFCRKKERNRDNNHPYKVIEITPPPKNLGIRCFPSMREKDHANILFVPCELHGWDWGHPRETEINLQCGESVTIEGQAYTISAVTHRYQLRKGKYEPSEKRLDVLSTGRYILNLYLESLLEQS